MFWKNIPTFVLMLFAEGFRLPVIETILACWQWLSGIMLQGQDHETSGITVKPGSVQRLWRCYRNATAGFFPHQQWPGGALSRFGQC
ncbi:hypothetical protein MJ569_02515 [Escherichia coli]|nr:hypothetical protein MJ569_02515 [Escherichia coli]